MQSRWVLAAPVVLFTAFAGPRVAAAAETAQTMWTVSMKGQKTGPVAMNVPVLAVSHEIVSPRDAASGLPTGKRMHKPMVITKELDKSTPLLFNVLVNNENVTEFALTKWVTRNGKFAPVFTIKLTNANVASIAMRNDPTRFMEYEEIAFTYQKIEWTWVDGGITAMDDWESPVY